MSRIVTYALDNAARYYREALKHVVEECGRGRSGGTICHRRVVA